VIKFTNGFFILVKMNKSAAFFSRFLFNYFSTSTTLTTDLVFLGMTNYYFKGKRKAKFVS